MILKTWIAAPCTALALALAAPAQAALTLTVDSYTTDEVTLTLGGTFDANSIGSSPGWLAVKNDYSNNVGSHTEWFNSAPIEVTNTILIGGLAPPTFRENGVAPYQDALFFQNPAGGAGVPFLVGTPVSGSITIGGIGAFAPAAAATLELASGYNPSSTNDWARFEASSSAAVTAVPEPSAMLLMGLASGATALRARRRKSDGTDNAQA